MVKRFNLKMGVLFAIVNGFLTRSKVSKFTISKMRKLRKKQIGVRGKSTDCLGNSTKEARFLKRLTIWMGKKTTTRHSFIDPVN